MNNVQTRKMKDVMEFKDDKGNIIAEIPYTVTIKYTLNDNKTEILNAEYKSCSVKAKGLTKNNRKAIKQNIKKNIVEFINNNMDEIKENYKKTLNYTKEEIDKQNKKVIEKIEESVDEFLDGDSNEYNKQQ